jgi:hypothetical protein
MKRLDIFSILKEGFRVPSTFPALPLAALFLAMPLVAEWAASLVVFLFWVGLGFAITASRWRRRNGLGRSIFAALQVTAGLAAVLIGVPLLVAWLLDTGALQELLGPDRVTPVQLLVALGVMLFSIRWGLAIPAILQHDLTLHEGLSRGWRLGHQRAEARIIGITLVLGLLWGLVDSLFSGVAGGWLVFPYTAVFAHWALGCLVVVFRRSDAELTQHDMDDVFGTPTTTLPHPK